MKANGKAVVTLGGREFKLEALTFDQLQEVIPHIDQSNPLTKEGMGELRHVLAIAFHGQISEDEIATLRTNFDELFEVQKRIAEVSGLRPLLDRLRMEKAPAALTGSTSTPSSALIPDGPGPT